MIREIEVKSALHYHSKKFATNYDLNIYRGCEHKCKYCFAQYSSIKYLEADFFNDIYVKINIADMLDRELSRKSWKKQFINISGVCDCYQPIEEKYQLMCKVLEILIKHKNPVFILTKSPLILRDIDLIEELSKSTKVCIATTITTLNENIRKKIEPNTKSSVERLNMIKQFAKIKNCITQVMMMPVIPYLTDNTKDIENLYKSCAEVGVDNVITAPINMRGDLKKFFYNFLINNFPNTYEKIQHLYKGAYISKDYNKKFYNFINKIRKKYGFCRKIELETEPNDSDFKKEYEQLSFNFSNISS